MKKWDTKTARALLETSRGVISESLEIDRLRASLGQALSFVEQFRGSPDDSFEEPFSSLDSCGRVQYRRVRDGLVDVRLDARMWWYEEHTDELGVVRFRLTVGDLEQMMEAVS